MPEPVTSKAGEPVQVRDLLRILRIRWRIVLGTLLIVLTVAATITLMTTPLYTSSTRVYLSAVGADGQANLYNMPSTEIDTVVQVANSPIVLDPVKEQVGAEGHPMSVSVEIAQGTTLLDVAVTTDEPQLAADLATAIPTQLASVAREFSPMLAQSGQRVEARTVVPAAVPSVPSSPDYVRNMSVAVLTGLLLGVGFALLRHNLDTRIRRKEDVAELSDRPVLGAVPLLKTQSVIPFMEADPFGPHAESMRRLRTNLMFVDVTTHKHSFVVTSAMPSEGKTTTAINLALAMSDAGTRVLLVDGDLRNPTVGRAMGLEDSVGLTTVLLGSAYLEDVVQRWADTNLWVLAAGEIPPNPSELLGSEAMREAFESMLASFDFVLVDSPPLVPVIDAVLLDKLTGGTLLVVAADQTRKRHLAEALRTLETADGTLAGFALNKVSAAEEAYHYKGYYGQQHAKDTERRSRGSRSAGELPASRAARREQSRTRR